MMCNVYMYMQWILLIKTHDGKEFMIHAPDEKTRTEWSGLIEECIRKLDPTKVMRYLFVGISTHVHVLCCMVIGSVAYSLLIICIVSAANFVLSYKFFLC